MKNTPFQILLLCCLSITLSAQITLRGQISNIPPSALQVAMVDYWAVDHWQQLVILQLQSGGTFSAKVVSPGQVQCRIRMAGQLPVWSDFLLPGSNEQRDTMLLFDLDMRMMNGSPARLSGYAENDLYFSLMTAYHSLSLLRDSSASTPPAQLQEAERGFNKICREMTQQHPGSFTGDIAANLLYQPAKEDYPKDPKVAGMTANAFVIAHALDKIPFRSDLILYHNAFVKALNRYYNYFDHTTADGSKNFIEGVMSKRNGNDAVDLYLFKYMLNKMLDNKDEAGLQHLLKWYLPDCSDESPLPDYTRTLIQALQNCEPGKIAPDIQMPGPDDQNISLASVCSKNKLTLMLFWRSNCSHCKEFKPILAEMYERYHPLGLEVYALSLDKLDMNWKSTLQVDPTKWVNVFVPTERREEITHLFPVPATPTLIALDSNRKVLNRLILRDQLEAYLKEKLPKPGGG